MVVSLISFRSRNFRWKTVWFSRPVDNRAPLLYGERGCHGQGGTQTSPLLPVTIILAYCGFFFRIAPGLRSLRLHHDALFRGVVPERSAIVYVTRQVKLFWAMALVSLLASANPFLRESCHAGFMLEWIMRAMAGRASREVIREGRVGAVSNRRNDGASVSLLPLPAHSHTLTWVGYSRQAGA